MFWGLVESADGGRAADPMRAVGALRSGADDLRPAAGADRSHSGRKTAACQWQPSANRRATGDERNIDVEMRKCAALLSGLYICGFLNK